MLWDAQNKAKLKKFVYLVLECTFDHSATTPSQFVSTVSFPTQGNSSRTDSRAGRYSLGLTLLRIPKLGQTQSLPEAGELQEWVLEEYRTAPGP